MTDMIPVCVYKDSTDLFTEEEILRDNLTDLLFPKSIVVEWYERHKEDLDATTAHELGIPLSECNFDRWYNEVSTAIDTDGLYVFALYRRFRAMR